MSGRDPVDGDAMMGAVGTVEERRDTVRQQLGPVELALLAMLREAARTRAARRDRLVAIEGGRAA